MIIFCKLLTSVGMILDSIVFLFIVLIIASVVLSWFGADPNNVLVRVLSSATDPIINLARRYVPPLGMFDLSPIVVLIVLQIISYVVAGSLVHYGTRCEAAAGGSVITA